MRLNAIIIINNAIKIDDEKIEDVSHIDDRLVGCERVLKRDCVSSTYPKPLIIVGTAMRSNWSVR